MEIFAGHSLGIGHWKKEKGPYGLSRTVLASRLGFLEPIDLCCGLTPFALEIGNIPETFVLGALHTKQYEHLGSL